MTCKNCNCDNCKTIIGYELYYMESELRCSTWKENIDSTKIEILEKLSNVECGCHYRHDKQNPCDLTVYIDPKHEFYNPCVHTGYKIKFNEKLFLVEINELNRRGLL